MAPFRDQIHVDQLLGNISVKYKSSEYIAMDVFPDVPVKKDSDLYRVYARNFRLPETKKANKGVAREHYFEVSTATYVLEKHALKDYVTDDDADNYDIADLRADTTEELTDVIMRRVEYQVAQLFTSTSWSLNVSLAAASAFNQDTTTSNPIPVFDTAASVVLANSGFAINTGLMPQNGLVAVKNHTSILDRVKYTSSSISKEMIQGLLGLKKLLIGTAQIDSSALGATESIGNIWPDHAWVGYVAENPGPRKPSAGYVFMKKKPVVKRWRDEEREAEAIEVQRHFQPKVVASLAGYLIKDII